MWSVQTKIETYFTSDLQTKSNRDAARMEWVTTIKLVHVTKHLQVFDYSGCIQFRKVQTCKRRTQNKQCLTRGK